MDLDLDSIVIHPYLRLFVPHRARCRCLATLTLRYVNVPEGRCFVVSTGEPVEYYLYSHGIPGFQDMYVADDVIRLFDAIPYLTLARPTALSLLRKLARDGGELKHVLALYPQVLYEPLELHYNCLRVTAALTDELVDELTTHYTWRGVVWAAWAVALRPEARFAPYLRSGRERAPRNTWIVDLALAEIERSECPAYAEHQTLTRTIRSFLQDLPRPVVRLRQCPTGPELAEVEAAKQDIRETYKALGTDAALARLRDSIVRSLFRLRTAR